MSKSDKMQDAAMIHKHERGMHPGKPLTKFSKGGVTTDQLKEYGRNIARIKNQFKKTGRGR